MKSWKTPTPEQVEQVVAQFTRPEMAAHFFDKLDNPVWINALRKHKIFKSPPSEVRRDDGISFPVWPAGRYLVRMAAYGEPFAGRAIQAVVEADRTDNHLTHLNYIELALAAPASVALPLVSSEITWIAGQSWLFTLLPEKYAELAARLVRNDCANEGFQLARVLLAVSPTDDSERAEPKARFDAWHYNETLKRLVPTLLQVDRLRTTGLLCELLSDAAQILSRGRSGETDRSYGWRAAIEESNQNWDHGRIEDQLVDAVRDAAEKSVKAEPGSLTTVLIMLRKRKSLSIFQRMALHLTRVFRSQARKEAHDELLNVSQMRSLDLRHEYSLLLRDGFADLSTEDRLLIIQSVSEGPDSSHLDLSTAEARAEFDLYSRHWKRDRFSFIRTHLDSSWSAVYDGLVEALGEPKHPEFSSHHHTWTGPVSPKEADALAQMNVDALVEYLVIWRPLRDFMAASPEGLGRALQQMAANRSGELLAHKDKLRRLHPIYIRAIVAGIAEGTKGLADRHTDSDALEFALWAVEQKSLPYELPGQFTDRDWNWTRRAIIDLITTLLTGKLELDIALRVQVWKILETLMTDPDPHDPPGDQDPEGYRPSEVALNSVRGSALHAVVRYMLWIRRWLDTPGFAGTSPARGFTAMPEVRALLDRHLDTATEKSLALRSVYGQWFPWFVFVDSAWASKAADRIFPLREDAAMFFYAAWQSYVSFNQVYRDSARLLARQYLHAAGLIGEESRLKIRSLRPPEVALGEHIMTLYGLGELELDSATMETFFRRASGSTRDAVLAQIGRSLMPPDQNNKNAESEQDRVPSIVIERFRKLWESRLGKEGHAEEASGFGWWFASGLFEDQWALNHLLKSIEDSSSIDALFFAGKRLGRLATSYPLETVRVLHVLTRKHDRPMWTYELRDAIRPILSAAIVHGGDANTLAIEVINRLGERGEGGYGDLLPHR